MQKLILHAHTTGPNPYKVAMVMENLQIPYELKLWEFGDGEDGVKGPTFLKINENGRVPAVGESTLDLSFLQSINEFHWLHGRS